MAVHRQILHLLMKIQSIRDNCTFNICSYVFDYVYLPMYVCMYIAYTDVTTIPSGARHVRIMDNGTSGNDMFIGMYVVHVCVW